MVKKRLRYEWTHEGQKFLGPSLDDEQTILRRSIDTIHEDISKNSGIRWKPPYFFVSFVLLVIFTGYAIAYLFITHQKYRVGTALLIATPLLTFVIIVIFWLLPARLERINRFMDVKCYEYQALCLRAGYNFSYVVIDGSTAQNLTRGRTRAGQSQPFIKKIFRAKLHSIVLEYSSCSDKEAVVFHSKLIIRTDQKTMALSLKKLKFHKTAGESQIQLSSENNNTERRVLFTVDTKVSEATNSLVDRNKSEYPHDFNRESELAPSLTESVEVVKKRREPVFKELEDNILEESPVPNKAGTSNSEPTARLEGTESTPNNPGKSHIV